MQLSDNKSFAEWTVMFLLNHDLFHFCRQSLVYYRQEVGHACEQFGDRQMKQKARILVVENLPLDCAVMSYKDRRVGYQKGECHWETSDIVITGRSQLNRVLKSEGTLPDGPTKLWVPLFGSCASSKRSPRSYIVFSLSLFLSFHMALPCFYHSLKLNFFSSSFLIWCQVLEMNELVHC